MNRNIKFDRDILNLFTKNWAFFVLWGIALLILGGVALYFSVATTIVTVLMIGILLFIGGIVVLIDSFQFWWKKSTTAFIFHLLIGLLYVIVGFMIFRGPLVGAITITLLMGYLFIIIGILRIIYALSARFPQWGWTLTSGILALILGILIFSGMPGSGLYIIGLFVGIDLFILGWVYLMLGITAKSLNR